MDGIDSYILLQSIAYLGPQKNKQRSFESFEEADEISQRQVNATKLGFTCHCTIGAANGETENWKEDGQDWTIGKKGLLIVFTGCSANILSKEWIK